MSRTSTSLRRATLEDALFLVDLWRDLVRDVDQQEQVHDLELIIKSTQDSTEQRLLICDYDGQPAGAVLLSISTVSALNLDLVVRAMAPTVAPSFRRRGVGHVLMDAAVAFAEERGIANVAIPVLNDSRAANRFMARLAFGPHALLRMGSTPMIRAQLTAQMPGRTKAGGRPGQVLAARRSLRRQRPPQAG